MSHRQLYGTQNILLHLMVSLMNNDAKCSNNKLSGFGVPVPSQEENSVDEKDETGPIRPEAIQLFQTATPRILSQPSEVHYSLHLLVQDTDEERYRRVTKGPTEKIFFFPLSKETLCNTFIYTALIELGINRESFSQGLGGSDTPFPPDQVTNWIGLFMENLCFKCIEVIRSFLSLSRRHRAAPLYQYKMQLLMLQV